MKLVLLDRDGVINRDRDDYIKSLAEFEFLPGAKEAIRRLTEAGYKVAIVSNQQGVGKGLISPETLEEIDRKLKKEVAEAGGRIDAAYYCPHLKEQSCGCRKPATGLLDQAARDFGVPLEETIVVGDSASDVEVGKRVGAYTIAVLSGKLSAAQVEALTIKPNEVVPDLSAAVDSILQREKK